MKKKSSLLLAMAIFATTANAQVYGTDEKNYIKYLPQEPKLVSTSEAKPFLSGQEKFCLSEPGANWFAAVKFGVSLFNGAPLGCGDAFDRTDVPQLAWFEENQIPFDRELSVTREIYADGKNSCRVNGRPVTVTTLRRLGTQLIQIHGQNDSQQLFDEATHIGYLDLFAHDEALFAAYREAFAACSAVQQEIRRLSMDESEKLRLVETLKFQIGEIERAELQPGEEDSLLERRKVLQNAEKLTDAMECAVAALYGDESSDGAAAMIADAAHALEKAGRVSDDMRALSQKLNDLMYAAQVRQ